MPDNVEWNGDKALMAVSKQLVKNLKKCGYIITNKVKEKLNESQPYFIYGKTGRWYRGQSPSVAGAAPKKIRGDLQRSYTSEVDPGELVVRIGSALPYAAYLELGTSRIQPRPHLRQTMVEEQDLIRSTLKEGIEEGGN